MQASPLRFGFIGAGKIAAPSAQSVNSHPRARVTAVQDTSLPRAQELCETFDIPTAYTTADELFADPEIDAVYVAVPNKFHAPLAQQALRAGKHVMLEKPFALNADEAAETIRVAEEVGKVLTLGMNMRFTNEARKLKAIASSGKLGEIYHAKAFWFRRTGIPKLGTWFGTRALSGGGAINDIGVHALDLCLHLMDRFDPVAVSGACYTKFGNRGLGEGGWGNSERENLPFDVDDFASAFLRMRDGSTVALDAAWACHQQSPSRFSVELFGTSGGASLDPLAFCHPGPEGEYHVENDFAPEISLTPADRFHNMIDHILDAEPLVVTPSQALTVQRILDAVNESARLGREITLD